MATVSGYKFIISIGGRHTTCSYCLLPDIQVTKAPDFLHAIQLTGLFFEPAQKQHQFVPV